MRARNCVVCLVSSTGGHMAEMERIAGAFKGAVTYYVTSGREDAYSAWVRSMPVYSVTDITERRGLRNPLLLVACLLQMLFIVLRRRPDAIITTGAGIAVPALLVGRILRVPSLFLESFTRIEHLSMSGRVCSRLATRFYVQHAALARQHRFAEYHGAVCDSL